MSGGKVSFSLGGAKKKAPKVAAFSGGSEETTSNQVAHERVSPLVIPLVPVVPQAITAKTAQEQEDEEAAAALTESANTREQNHATSHGGTNFSAHGSLVIAGVDASSTASENVVNQTKNTKKPLPILLASRNPDVRSEDDDETKFRKDMIQRASDVDPDSDVYEAVPVAEFGAALLRGMGWQGNNDNSNNANNKKKQNSADADADGMPAQRHHRLGLGATPKPLGVDPERRRRRPLKPGQKDREAEAEQLAQEWKQKAREKALKDKQLTNQPGSIVLVNDAHNSNNKQRAILVKTAGVPGLNQVLIRYEYTGEQISINRGSIVLVSQDELDQTPFVDNNNKQQRANQDKDRRESRRIDNNSDDRDAPTGRPSSSHSSRNQADDADSRRRHRGHDDQEDDRRRRRDRKRDRDDGTSDDGKRSQSGRTKDDPSSRKRHRDRDHHAHDRTRDTSTSSSRHCRANQDEIERKDHHRNHPHWLVPNIRVRVVTKKFGSRHYKQKGVVLDVTYGGSKGILQMGGGVHDGDDNNGRVLEHVPERYLETALPPVGGPCIILAPGENMHAKGRLLQRSTTQGVVQLAQDMNVVTVSLDHMAEWCLPLDEDME